MQQGKNENGLLVSWFSSVGGFINGGDFPWKTTCCG